MASCCPSLVLFALGLLCFATIPSCELTNQTNSTLGESPPLFRSDGPDCACNQSEKCCYADDKPICCPFDHTCCRATDLFSEGEPTCCRSGYVCLPSGECGTSLEEQNWSLKVILVSSLALGIVLCLCSCVICLARRVGRRSVMTNQLIWTSSRRFGTFGRVSNEIINSLVIVKYEDCELPEDHAELSLATLQSPWQ